MRKTIAVLGSALFFVVAPCVAGGAHPVVDHALGVSAAFLRSAGDARGRDPVDLAGLPGLVDSFARFALQGLGTPAPIAPPQNLVVTGLYRYVRNPMYVAVVAVILGQAILFGDWRLMTYGALMWLAFHAFVLAYEEPVLAAELWRPVRGFPRQRPALDSAAVALARRMRPPSQWRRRGERRHRQAGEHQGRVGPPQPTFHKSR